MTQKDVQGKAKLDLIPYKALVKVAEVREYGIKKYKDDQGWKSVAQKDFAVATLRHIYKWINGEQLDDESGLHHLHHAACSIMLAIGQDDDK